MEKENGEGTVFLVDDDESFRRSISRLLSLSGFRVHDYPSVGNFLLGFPRASEGCLVLDIRMPGPDGMELLSHLRREGNGIPVVFLTGHGNVAVAVDAMRKGAFDVLTKPVEKKRLIEVIQKALLYGEGHRRNEERHRELQERYQTLTSTEKRVFQLVVAGLPNKAIAESVGNAERTVKLHRSNLSKKLGAQCVADLVRFHFEGRLGESEER